MSDEMISPGGVLDSPLYERIRQATVPLYFGVRGGEIQFDRSAVVLAVADDCFLLTAVHELAAMQRPDVYSFIPQGGGSKEFVDITGSPVAAYPEPVDIGAVRIHRDRARRIASFHNAARLQDLDLTQQWDETTPFVVHGYPKSYETREPSDRGPVILPRPFTLASQGYLGELENPGSYSRDVHIAIQMERKFVGHTFDGRRINEPEPLSAPDPKGMSGCGIWRIAKNHEGPPTDDNLVCRLSAVQNRAHPRAGYAIGTRVSMALLCIWYQFSELRPEIEKVFPAMLPNIGLTELTEHVANTLGKSG